jgi:hypothetical protein
MKTSSLGTSQYQRSLNDSLLWAYQQPFTILLSFFLLFSASLRSQCLFDGATGTVVADDFDNGTAPYATEYNVFPVIGANVDVTSIATVTICFWGDMSDNDETFDVVISGQTFPTTNFSF